MTVAIIMNTYNRLEYAIRTMEALKLKLACSEEIWMHVADDGSSQEYRDKLWSVAGQYWGDRRSITNSERRGYGASHNMAINTIMGIGVGIGGFSAYLMVEDDWELLERLDLDPLVAVVNGNDGVGMIRLSYIGYNYELRAKFLWIGSRHYLLLDPDSPSEYVFSGNPRLVSPAWEAKVGPWIEGVSAGQTEIAVGSLMAARTGVVWPADLIHPSGGLFRHFGDIRVADDPVVRMRTGVQV